MKSAKKKIGSGTKTAREQTNKIGKSHSHNVLPTKRRELSQNKQKASIKRTQSKKRVQRVSTIQERISNIKRGFQELQRKIIHSQQVTESITQPDVRRLIQSATRSIKTKTNMKSIQKSPSKEKSSHKGKQKRCHNCVYSKAVFNLISIINYQKAEIQSLQGQPKLHTYR